MAMRALTELLDHLEHSVSGDDVAIGDLVDEIGPQSFAALMLIFALISTSPASAIPGVTSLVALIEFLLVVQMIAGRHSAVIAGRRLEPSPFETKALPGHCMAENASPIYGTVFEATAETDDQASRHLPAALPDPPSNAVHALHGGYTCLRLHRFCCDRLHCHWPSDARRCADHAVDAFPGFCTLACLVLWFQWPVVHVGRLPADIVTDPVAARSRSSSVENDNHQTAANRPVI